MSSWAQLMRAGPVYSQTGSVAASSGPPVASFGPAGIAFARSLAFGASTPWERISCSRGRGTSAARRCMNSSGDFMSSRGARLDVDTVGALSKCGDRMGPLSRSAIGVADVASTLATLSRGEAAGRATTEDRTAVKSVGTALQNLAAAILVCDGTPAPETRGSR